MKKIVALVAALVLALFPTVVNAAVDSPSQGGCSASDISAEPYNNGTVVTKVKAQIDSAYEFVKAYDLTADCDVSGGVTYTFQADLSDASAVLVAHVTDEASAKWERVEKSFTGSTVTVEFSSLSPFLIFKKVANDTTGGGTSGGSGSNASVLPNTDVQ